MGVGPVGFSRRTHLHAQLDPGVWPSPGQIRGCPCSLIHSGTSCRRRPTGSTDLDRPCFDALASRCSLSLVGAARVLATRYGVPQAPERSSVADRCGALRVTAQAFVAFGFNLLSTRRPAIFVCRFHGAGAHVMVTLHWSVLLVLEFAEMCVDISNIRTTYLPRTRMSHTAQLTDIPGSGVKVSQRRNENSACATVSGSAGYNPILRGCSSVRQSTTFAT